jgi:5-methylcytosine-specific restriction protein B
MDDNGVDRTKLRIQYEIVPILEEYIKDGVFKDAEPVKEVISELIEYTTEETDD